MDRKGGTATAAILVAAVLGFSFLPRPGSESGGGSEASKAQQTARKLQHSSAQKIAACEEIVKRLNRFSSGEVSISSREVPVIKSCYSDPGAYRPLESNIGPKVHFAIALVPNPIQTHLPLAFDRSIEVIQEAAEDNNFIYDSSWFPWDHPDKSLELYADQKLADAEMEAQQLQPGIMVFRAGASAPDADTGKPGGDGPYEAGLVVFVVGEQPTGGINDRQFENAMSWLEALQTETPRPLKILGPAFSGSLPSLARELDVSTLGKFPGGIEIYSGSINSEWSVKWFKNFTEQKSQPPKNTIDFRTFNESDALMMNRFLCYLEHGKYDLSRVAILSEDETAFGRASESGKSESGKDDAKNSGSMSPLCAGGKGSASPIHLYYPRDIATLRSAYERQGIFSAAKGQANNAPGTMLQGDLSESPGEEHDSVRTYAGQLTPLAQESVLFGIANLLQQKHVEFVIVTSTNSLDQLFISEFLRRSYPSGRVVLDGADLLFRRGMEGASLRGVMLLSTYPLMPWTQDGIPVLARSSSGEWQFEGRVASKDSYRIFSEDFVEGIYIAARELLPSGRDAVVISDYAPPRLALKRDRDFNDNRRPLTWVSVVGHRQFWPIAMLNSYTQSNGPSPRLNVSDPSLPAPDPSLLKPASGDPLSNTTTAGQARPEGSGARIERFSAGAPMPGEMVALLVFGVAFSLWHAWLCWNGAITGSPRVRAYFAPVPEVQHSILIFLGSFFLGVFAITVLGGSGTTSPLAWKFWSGNFLVWTLVSVLIIVACGLVGLIANYRLPILPGITSRTEQRFAKPWVWGVVWLLLLLVVAWQRHSLLTSHLDISNQIPTIWRSVHFRSGVSPLLPQVLLIAGLYAWFWFSLRGLALFGDDRPVLPRLHSLPDFVVDPKLGPILESEDDTVDRSTSASEEAFARQNALRNGTEMRGFRMFSQEEAGKQIEQAAVPLTRKQVGLFLVALFVALFACWATLGTSLIRTLGDRDFGYLIFVGMCVFIALILTDTVQFLSTWGRLRTLLVFLDRLRLRRTLACLKGISWQSVWSMSGNVLEERYRLLSRQMESTQHLQNELERWNPSPDEAANKEIALKQLKECQEQGFQFAKWYVDLIAGKTPESIAPLQQYQETLAKTAGRIMGHVILPEWMKERHSLILEAAAVPDRKSDSKEEKGSAENSGQEEKRAPLNPRLRAAEEFFVLPYLGFIQNIMGRIRTMCLSILALFVAVTLAMSSYPFDPLPVIGAIFLVLFLMVGGVVIFVYAEMHRNATLSNITNSNPGELGMDFWVRILTYGAGPLAALLTTLFPSITDFVVSFLQPGAQAIK